MDEIRALIYGKMTEKFCGEIKKLAGYRFLATEQLRQAQVILGNVPLQWLEQAPELRWLQLDSAGSEKYLEALRDRPEVLLSNASGAFGAVMGEYAVAGVLSLYNRLFRYRENQRQGRWEKLPPARQIHGSTVLAVGLGDVGGSCARAFAGLGGSVIGVCRRGAGSGDGQQLLRQGVLRELHGIEKLPGLLPLADIVLLALPETPETKGLLCRPAMERMRAGAVLVNVGRGSAVDLDCLTEFLAEGRLGGAVLDVTCPEPLPAEHPLWRQENALITPHISGPLAHEESRARVEELFLCNLERYQAGEPLCNLVDRQNRY